MVSLRRLFTRPWRGWRIWGNKNHEVMSQIHITTFLVSFVLLNKICSMTGQNDVTGMDFSGPIRIDLGKNLGWMKIEIYVKSRLSPYYGASIVVSNPGNGWYRYTYFFALDEKRIRFQSCSTTVLCCGNEGCRFHQYMGPFYCLWFTINCNSENLA